MKKYYYILIALAVCFAFFSFPLLYKTNSATISPSTGESTLRISLRTEPLCLDPRKSSDAITGYFLPFLHEGLTRIGRDGKIALALASEVETSDDLKSYVFSLREAYWSDGRPITAHDFEYSWKKVLDPTYPSHCIEYFWVLKNAKAILSGAVSLDKLGVMALDEKTLRVDLEVPSPTFLQILSNKMFFPVRQDLDDANPGYLDKYSELFVNAGPYEIEKWELGDEIWLRKNPHYWDQSAVMIEKVHFSVIEDETTEYHMFEKGNLDWAGGPFSILPVETVLDLKKSKSCHLHSFMSMAVYFYSLNTKMFPLTNKNIRKALAYSIDRQALIDHVTQCDEMPAYAFVPPSQGRSQKKFFDDQSIGLAKKLFQDGLEEENLTLDNFPSITLSTPNLQVRRIIAQAIQQDWQRNLGIKVNLVSKEWQVLLSELNSKHYQIAGLGRGSMTTDPLFFLTIFHDCKKRENRTNWENYEYQSYLKEATAIADCRLRNDILEKAESILMDEMPVIPLFYQRIFYLKNSKLSGIIIGDSGVVEFKWAYFED